MQNKSSISLNHKMPESLSEAHSMISELLKLNEAARINADARLAYLESKFATRLKFELKQQRAKLLADMDLRYGTRSEITRRLFDEPETASVIEEIMREAETRAENAEGSPSDLVNSDEASGKNNTEPTSKKRSKRKVLPDHLPREDVIHDLGQGQKICQIDGAALVKIGEDVREELMFKPAKLWVRRHITPKYGCPACHEGVSCACPAAPRLLPGTVASPSILSHLVVSKFVDHLPLYRQEQIFARHKVEITRATLANWIIKVGQSFIPLVNLIRDEILSSDAIQCDETPVQVLKENGIQTAKKRYMWVMGRAGPGPKAILFEYGRGRGGDVATRLLGDYKGLLQVDGYKSYDQLYYSIANRRLGCMAHVRRKFVALLKTLPKHLRHEHPAATIVKMIGKLYEIEDEIRGMPSDFRRDVRQEKAAKIFAELVDFITSESLSVAKTSPYGIALNYAMNELPRVRLYLSHGECEIDNNAIENAIRPFALGRKNWLFSDTESGVESSAAIYTVLQTAKANGLNVSEYMDYILEALPACQSIDDYVKLLPWNTFKAD